MLTIKRTDYYDIDWLSSTQVGNYDHPHITKALLGRTLLVLVIVIIIGQSHFHEIMIINHHKCIHMLIFHQFHYIPLRSLNWGKGLLWIIGDTSFYIIINYTYIYIYTHH